MEQNSTAHVYKVEEVKRTYGPFEHASAEENRLHAMTDEQLEAEIDNNLKDYKEMELKLFQKPSATSYQIPRHMRFFAAQGRRAAMLAGSRLGEDQHHFGRLPFLVS